MWKDFKYKKREKKKTIKYGSTRSHRYLSLFFEKRNEKKEEHVQIEWQERFFNIPKQARFVIPK